MAVEDIGEACMKSWLWSYRSGTDMSAKSQSKLEKRLQKCGSGSTCLEKSYMTLSDSISLSMKVCSNGRDLHVFK